MEVDEDQRKSNFSSISPSNGAVLRGSGSSAKGDVKKLVIKNFKSKFFIFFGDLRFYLVVAAHSNSIFFSLFFFSSEKPSLPENYQERTWEKLREAVIAIQTSTPIAYCLEELYQAVENMCSHKMDSHLYVNLTGLAENHVKSNIRPFLADSADKLVRIRFA